MTSHRNVFVLFICVCLFPTVVSGATMRASADKHEYTEGDMVTVTISTDSSDVAMNAAQGTLSFSSKELTFISIDTTASILKHWVSKPFVSAEGKITFEGIIMSPGFVGSFGNLFTVRFLAMSQGTAKLNILSASVLANDGKGTDILTQVIGDTFIIHKKVEYIPPSQPENKIEEPPLDVVDSKDVTQEDTDLVQENAFDTGTTGTTSMQEEVFESEPVRVDDVVPLTGSDTSRSEIDGKRNIVPWIALGIFIFFVVVFFLVLALAVLSVKRKNQ